MLSNKKFNRKFIMPPKLSIRIPIYNQPDLLNECLTSLRNQSFSDFDILLIDDCSNANYSLVVKEFNDLQVEYIRNESNLGALENMLFSLYYKSDHDYVMVMHEDDILHPAFLQDAIHSLEKNQSVAFSVTTLNFFSETKLIDFNTILNKKEIICRDKSEFIFNILSGQAVGFGSVIYRQSKLSKINFDFKTYAEVGDRPFLAEICNKKGCVILPNNSFFARLPIGKDTRWKLLKYKHLINLYCYYKSNLLPNLDKKNQKIIKIGFTHNFLESYNNLSNKNIFKFLITIFYLNKLDIISIKYLLLKSKNVRRINSLLK